MSAQAIIALAAVAVVLAAIYALAHQGIAGTQDLALRTERLLMRIVPPTGTGDIGEPTWLGLTIRRLAHVAEYAVLGLACAVATTMLFGAGPRSSLLALVGCLAASVADEAHKAFVPGRHFDAADLRLDAIGYLPAIAAVTALAALC